MEIVSLELDYDATICPYLSTTAIYILGKDPPDCVFVSEALEVYVLLSSSLLRVEFVVEKLSYASVIVINR